MSPTASSRPLLFVFLGEEGRGVCARIFSSPEGERPVTSPVPGGAHAERGAQLLFLDDDSEPLEVLEVRFRAAMERALANHVGASPRLDVVVVGNLDTTPRALVGRTAVVLQRLNESSFAGVFEQQPGRGNRTLFWHGLFIAENADLSSGEGTDTSRGFTRWHHHTGQGSPVARAYVVPLRSRAGILSPDEGTELLARIAEFFYLSGIRETELVRHWLEPGAEHSPWFLIGGAALHTPIERICAYFRARLVLMGLERLGQACAEAPTAAALQRALEEWAPALQTARLATGPGSEPSSLASERALDALLVRELAADRGIGSLATFDRMLQEAQQTIALRTQEWLRPHSHVDAGAAVPSSPPKPNGSALDSAITLAAAVGLGGMAFLAAASHPSFSIADSIQTAVLPALALGAASGVFAGFFLARESRAAYALALMAHSEAAAVRLHTQGARRTRMKELAFLRDLVPVIADRRARLHAVRAGLAEATRLQRGTLARLGVVPSSDGPRLDACEGLLPRPSVVVAPIVDLKHIGERVFIQDVEAWSRQLLNAAWPKEGILVNVPFDNTAALEACADANPTVASLRNESAFDWLPANEWASAMLRAQAVAQSWTEAFGLTIAHQTGVRRLAAGPTLLRTRRTGVPDGRPDESWEWAELDPHSSLYLLLATCPIFLDGA